MPCGAAHRDHSTSGRRQRRVGRTGASGAGAFEKTQGKSQSHSTRKGNATERPAAIRTSAAGPARISSISVRPLMPRERAGWRAVTDAHNFRPAALHNRFAHRRAGQQARPSPPGVAADDGAARMGRTRTVQAFRREPPSASAARPLVAAGTKPAGLAGALTLWHTLKAAAGLAPRPARYTAAAERGACSDRHWALPLNVRAQVGVGALPPAVARSPSP